MIIQAPFSPQQVDQLNKWQSAGFVHEFACEYRSDSSHGELPLVATVRGWICPYCEYTQPWAHDFMTEPLQEPKLEETND